MCHDFEQLVKYEITTELIWLDARLILEVWGVGNWAHEEGKVILLIIFRIYLDS